MQAGEVIWLLAGIGIGLTIAMVILAVVAGAGVWFVREVQGLAPAPAEPPAPPAVLKVSSR